MDFWFDVGHQEVHRVAFSFDKLWGKVRITVDGIPVVDQTLWFYGLVKPFPFVVGHYEQHQVVIEMTRKLMLSYARPMVFRVLIDGWHVHTFEG